MVNEASGKNWGNGFSSPYFMWDPNFPAVADAGCRAVRYDLYGRGFSDRPTNLRYDSDLFDRQLFALIGKLKTPVTLVGCSMRGSISVIFAESHPELVNGLILVDAGGLTVQMAPARAAMLKLVRLPGVGE